MCRSEPRSLWRFVTAATGQRRSPPPCPPPRSRRPDSSGFSSGPCPLGLGERRDFSAFQSSHHTPACTQQALNKCWSDVNKSVSLFPFTAVEGNRLLTATTAGFASPVVWWQNWNLLAHPCGRLSASQKWRGSRRVWLKHRGARPFTGAGGGSDPPRQAERGPLKTQGSRS